MTQVDHVKSASITNLDASPKVANTTGESASGYLKHIQDNVTLTSGTTADGTYQVLRVPANAKMKFLYLTSAAQGASSAVDVGVYYATNGELQKPTSLLAASAIDQDFFASAVDLTNAVARTDVVNESTTNTAAKRNQPLWQAVGLTADPGGWFDIVLTVTTTIGTGGGILTLEAMFVV